MPNFPSFNHNCWNLKVLDSHKFKYVQQALKLFFNLQKSTNILNDLEIWLDFQFSSFLLEIFWILLHCQHVLNLCISWICIEYWENVKTASLPLFSMYFTHQYLCLKKLEEFYKILFSCHNFQNITTVHCYCFVAQSINTHAYESVRPFFVRL